MNEREGRQTFDGAKEAAAVGVLGDDVLGDDGAVGVDVVDGELDGEPRGAANDSRR